MKTRRHRIEFLDGLRGLAILMVIIWHAYGTTYADFLAYDLIIGVGPHAQRSAINLIPGLLFVSPAIIHTLTRLSIESMDGTFWSLYVEVSFYLVFGFLFFRFGLLAAIGLIFGLSFLACTMG